MRDICDLRPRLERFTLEGMNERTQHAAGRERLAELRAQLERQKLLEQLALRLAERADELESALPRRS